MKISRGHPRFESLRIREVLVKGLRDGLVAPQGLLAHGRGEAFDYLLGERSLKAAEKAIRASAALLLTAKDPVLSVNGNTAVLVSRDVSRLASLVPAKVEVNLFHRDSEREWKIARLLRRRGVNAVFGVGEHASTIVPGISSNRRNVDPRGIGRADVVLVPLEDGDRTKALREVGKRVIAIDLNPLSRTAQGATFTIVDNVVRAFPRLVGEVVQLKKRDRGFLETLVSGFDNEKNLSLAVKEIRNYLGEWM